MKPYESVTAHLDVGSCYIMIWCMIMVVTDSALWRDFELKLTVVFEYYEAKETYSRI